MSKRHFKTSKQTIKSNRSMSVVDIVIPVLNQFDLLDKCLKSIPKSISDPYRIIIFDNGSKSEDANKFYSSLGLSPNISIIRKRENLGFPKACNVAASSGNSPFIFFLNSDVELYPDALDILLEETRDEKIGVLGMKLIFPENDTNIRPSGKLQHIGIASNIRAEMFHIFIGWNPDHPKVNAVREVYAVTGAALLTRRNLWTKLGGFRLEYGLGTYEDVDYCLSVRELGYNIIVNPKAAGIHFTGASAQSNNLQYPLEYNRMIFMQKWANKLKYTEWLHW